jgi:hypothetical protein
VNGGTVSTTTTNSQPDLYTEAVPLAACETLPAADRAPDSAVMEAGDCDTVQAADSTPDDEVTLPVTVRLKDGREATGARPPEWHREVHLAYLHAMSRGFIEIAAGNRDEHGKLDVYTRSRREYFVPAGGPREHDWRTAALAIADRHLEAGEELFLGVAPRAQLRGYKPAVQWSRWLWLDIDGPEHLGRLEALLNRKPAHLLVESAGSGGMHAYWRLARRLPATKIVCEDGRTIENPLEVRERVGEKGGTRLVGYRELASKEVITLARRVEPIERGNLRLLHALGQTSVKDKVVPVGDPQCREQSRVLRWAGSPNGKTGKWARIVRIDLWLPPYQPEGLLHDLPDPEGAQPVRRKDLRRLKYDAYRLIPADVYFQRLAGITLPERGNINCPSPSHEDRTASCSVDAYVFDCHGCEAQGTYIDLWALLHRLPVGDALAADRDAFRRARKGAQDALKDLV